jgi:predicted RND superfamily exporter protein
LTGYFRFALRHRLGLLGLVLVMTALSSFAISTGVIATSVRKMFFGTAPEYERYLDRIRQFANDEAFIVAYEDPAPLSPRSLDRLELLRDRIEALPEVARTQSLLDAQRIRGSQGTLHVAPYAELAREHGAQPQDLLATLQEDELYRDLLLAADGRAGALIVELTVDPERSAERSPELVRQVLGMFEQAGFAETALHRAGLPAVLGEIVDQTHQNLRRLFPLTVLVLLAVSFLMFKRVAPALMAMAIAGLSVVWTMGFARLLDREISIFMSQVPTVVLIVAFSDVIHLWSAFLLERESGKKREQAILDSAADVGTACLLTSATTFVGFLSLSAVPTPMFRMVGLVLGFGVAVALLLAMTLVPLTLSWLRPPPLARQRGTGLGVGSWVSALLRLLARIATRRPWMVLAVFAGLFAVSLWGLARVHVETDLDRRLGEDTRFYQDQQFYDARFAGKNMLEVFVDTDQPEGLLEPAVLRRVAALQQQLEALPEVDRVISLVTLLETIHRALGEPGQLPATRAAVAQYLLLFELAGGDELDRLVSVDRSSMRLAVRLRTAAVRASHALGVAAQRLGERVVGADGETRVSVTSMSFLMGWWLGNIVEGERNGLLLSFVIIAVMMSLGLRSIRVGILSMLPNLLPLLALGGYLGFAYDNVDSDTVVIAILALGIGVDDTIHFLMRYRIESQKRADRALALERAFAFSGRAIIITTLVLVAGFMPFASSSYYSANMMGTLLPGVLLLALAADLLLVPAMVRVGLLDFRRCDPEPQPCLVARAISRR